MHQHSKHDILLSAVMHKREHFCELRYGVCTLYKTTLYKTTFGAGGAIGALKIRRCCFPRRFWVQRILPYFLFLINNDVNTTTVLNCVKIIVLTASYQVVLSYNATFCNRFSCNFHFIAAKRYEITQAINTGIDPFARQER
jgi:hypothetical protein